VHSEWPINLTISWHVLGESATRDQAKLAFFLRTCPVIKSEKLFVERWRKVHSRFSEDPVMLQMAQCTKFRIGQLAASSHGCSEHSLGWWDPLGNDGILSDVEGAVLTSVL
jgi:hypothetical protein